VPFQMRRAPLLHRGHLAAAAGHKDSQRAMDETFKLCNVSPQVGAGFNRDYWVGLDTTFHHHVIFCSQNMVQLMTPGWMIHVL
jgi:endonuclease G